MYSDADTETLCQILMDYVLNDDLVPVELEAELDFRGVTIDCEVVLDENDGTLNRWTVISVYQGAVTVH